MLESPDHDILVSAVTPWEISIKQASGRIDFPLDRFDEIIAGMGFGVLPIECAHGIEAGRLPKHHRDPFDRMLIAQAMTGDLTLVSADRAFDRYDVPVLGNASH